VTQLTKLIGLYACNNTITVKMAGYRPKHVGGNDVNKIRHKFGRSFVGYLHILYVIFNFSFNESKKEKYGTKEDEIHKRRPQ
jgi:hypothetical protein